MADNFKKETQQICKTFEDGFIVREMTSDDTEIVHNWLCTDPNWGKLSKYDLDICLKVFPKGQGFYIGEYEGQVVASVIRIPWSQNIFFGSYYYVIPKYRNRGFGTRIRDQVAREYVGDNMLCVDAIQTVADRNASKFGYKHAFITSRFEGPAKEDYGIIYKGSIVQLSTIPFDEFIKYDNKCFITQKNPIRKKFLAQWTSVPDGATYVALSQNGEIEGYISSRPCLQEGWQQIGPLYAENVQVAEALLQDMCKHLKGKQISVDLWYPNTAAVAMVLKFGLTHVFDLWRMHFNGDPKEYKECVFCLTSVDVCGF